MKSASYLGHKSINQAIFKLLAPQVKGVARQIRIGSTCCTIYL